MREINYEFKDLSLMELALTQSGADASNNNERLEFIGDRVLGLTVAEILYRMYPDEEEGQLARRHSMLVSTDTLAYVAKKIGLDRRIRHGHMTGGRARHVWADGMEAVLGAVFIDGGFIAAAKVVRSIWADLAAANAIAPKDPKTALQEFVQHADNGALPVYEYPAPTGASHSPVFTATVTAMGKSATATGTSKKNASMSAAAELLKTLANTETAG